MVIPNFPFPNFHFTRFFLVSPWRIVLGAWLILFFCTPGLFSQNADAGAEALWGQIQTMEEGPKGSPKDRKEAAEQIRTHLTTHLRLLERFIAEYPRDPRQFQARLRQAALIASLATLDGDQQGLTRSYRLLGDLEKARGISRQQAADAGFQRVSVLFLQARGNESRMRENIVNAATNFNSRYPGDRRGPRLLVEAASLTDLDPRTRQALLETALRDTREEPLKERIRDLLRQVDLLGQQIRFTMPYLQGGKGDFSVAQEKGRVVLLVFWSADSPQSLYWLNNFLPKAAELPSQAAVVLVSVDKDREIVREIVQEMGLSYPVLFSAEGWENKSLRELGVNAVPGLWILDGEGRLRSTNARADFPVLVRQLLRD